jgi:hypothetical protein
MEISDWKRRLQKLRKQKLKRAERRTPSVLAARFGSDSAPKLGHVKEISTTGLYLTTEERWPVGEVISLTMQKIGSQESLSEFQINVEARVASHGEDGVGLGFVLPNGLDANLWETLIIHVDSQPETEDLSFIFRLVRAILFLCRVCPSGAKEAIDLLSKELDEPRTKSAINIALAAEKMLAGEPNADRLHPHPQIVESIFKHGSWSSDDLLQRFWAGLLTSLCTAEGTDESNRAFVELLVQVTATQAHILHAGCRKSRELMAGVEGEPGKEIIITPKEMIEITGNYDLYRNATDVAYLFNFGLLEKVFDFTSYLPKDSFEITPSSLGLQLFKICRAG